MVLNFFSIVPLSFCSHFLLQASLDAYITSLREKGVPEAKVESLSTALSYLTYVRMQVSCLLLLLIICSLPLLHIKHFNFLT